MATGPKIGITGTRKGARPEQQDALWRILKHEAPEEFHHGDCLGVDELGHHMAERLSETAIVIHPPIVSTLRAYCISRDIRLPKEYMARNRDIVDETDVLIVVPDGYTPRQHSGTWLTAKYARRIRRPMIFVFPNGKVEWQA